MGLHGAEALCRCSTYDRESFESFSSLYENKLQRFLKGNRKSWEE